MPDKSQRERRHREYMLRYLNQPVIQRDAPRLRGQSGYKRISLHIIDRFKRSHRKVKSYPIYIILLSNGSCAAGSPIAARRRRDAEQMTIFFQHFQRRLDTPLFRRFQITLNIATFQSFILPYRLQSGLKPRF